MPDEVVRGSHGDTPCGRRNVPLAQFGNQGDLYAEFSIMSFRIFTLLCFVNGFQAVAAIFFQSIGKPVLSGALSLSRQIVFLIPAVVILCNRMGVKGVLWAGPVADGLAFVLALVLILAEIKKINRLEQKKGIAE